MFSSAVTALPLWNTNEVVSVMRSERRNDDGPWVAWYCCCSTNEGRAGKIRVCGHKLLRTAGVLARGRIQTRDRHVLTHIIVNLVNMSNGNWLKGHDSVEKL